MIRMIQSKSAGHAKAYFADALSKSDYYVSDQELTGFWEGKLAHRLGLSDATTKDGFFALCENQDPRNGEHLTPRTKDERTTGYDINFHCPKSVSILHALSNDGHILEAFQASVSDTMKVIEADAKTRVRKEGAYDDRATGELAWAHFVHQTARPVEGHSPDPHLHSHCFVFNATWDEVEGKCKAAQFRDINRDMPYYQAQFHKALSDRLIELGYSIRATDKSFEIDGLPKAVIDLFSKRTDEIGRIAKEKGITDAKELDDLGARTRAKKQKGASMSDLKKEWRSQIEALGGQNKGEEGKALRYAKEAITPAVSARDCVDHALLHCFERASVMDGRRLIATALKYGIGRQGVSVKDITNTFHKDDRVIHVKEKSRTFCTTKEVLREEKHMVTLARQGQGKMVPLYDQPVPLTLKGQQAEAINHILTTSHRVSIIRGAAGTGKTTLMRAAVDKIEAAGKKITVVAPTAQASRGVLRDEGFGDADTVAKLIADKQMQASLKGQVLWVDEAGLLGTKDMAALLQIATTQNARLILGGDTRQHASVVRGDALRILNTVAGIRTAEVSKIYRQQGEQYRAAVEDLSKGKVADGFDKLDALQFIKTVDPLKPNAALIDDYIGAIQKGKSTLIIAPTHAQGEAVTEALRHRLRAEGLIGKKEIAADKMTSLNLTEAQKADARSFQANQFVQFNQHAPGFKRGSMWQVSEVNDADVIVKNADGVTQALPLKISQRFDVFRDDKIHLSKGDKIRITRNGFDENEKRLNNGDVLEVLSVSKKGVIKLRSDGGQMTYKLGHKFGHLAHARCVTSHASQGKTVDEVFISQPAATFAATDAKQFYVSVSRGRQAAHIYTDDKETLLSHVNDQRERQSAHELLYERQKNNELVAQWQRHMDMTEKIKETKTHEFEK